MSKIYRAPMIRGVTMPTFIEVGRGNYHFIDTEVYEDGLIYYWYKASALNMFKAMAKRVATTPPDDSTITIRDMGIWKINGTKWNRTPQMLYEEVEFIVKTLNPGMENMYQPSARASQYPPNPEAIPYREGDAASIATTRQKATTMNLFYKHDNNRYYLAALHAFPDGGIQLSHLPETIQLEKSQVEALVFEERLLTDIPLGQRVYVEGIGSFVPEKKTVRCFNILDKLLQVDDLIEEANDRPTTIEKFYDAYGQFIGNPTEELRREMRERYKKVPAHLWQYTDGRGSRDFTIRKIIYGNEDIEYWKKNWVEMLLHLDGTFGHIYEKYIGHLFRRKSKD